MIHSTIKRGLLLAALLACAGCSAFSHFPSRHVTEVELGSNNYRIAQTGVTGSDWGWALFGLIPLGAPSMNSAMTELLAKVPAYQGSSMALVNVTEARHGSFWILFSIYSIELRADVVEFTGD